MGQRHTTYGLEGDAESRIGSEFGNVYSTLQGKTHKVLTRAPVVGDLGDGEVIFAVVSGVKRVYVKIDGALFYAALTAA